MANKRKKRGLKITILILSIIVISVGAFCIYANSLLSNFSFVNTTETESGLSVSSEKPKPTESTIDPGTTFSTSGANQVDGLFTDEAVTNILVLGLDDYQDDDPIGRSDSTMLVSIDKRHQKIKLSAFLRDTYVSIPTYGGVKLTEAYHYAAYDYLNKFGGEAGNPQSVAAGANETVNVVEQYFGARIDQFVVVKDDAFDSVIDSVGGVDIELTQLEADDINEYSGSDNYCSAGTSHLDGAQAHRYCRIRDEEIPNYQGEVGDPARAQRQQVVISAISQQLKGFGLLKINTIATNVFPKIITNFTSDKMANLISQSPFILKYEIDSLQVPETGDYDCKIYPDTGDCVVLYNLDKTRKKYLNFLYEDDKPSVIPKTSNECYATQIDGFYDVGGYSH